MKVIFAGTPEFARVALEALHVAGFEIVLVLTQPDRPAGRGLKLQASPVKQWAVAQHIPVAQPRSLRLDGKYPEDAAAARQLIEAAGADVMVVAAYGLILPQWVLDLMEGRSEPHEAGSTGASYLGCLNIHASLLPRWRGAAPIHRAIEAGDSETGITIMQMDAGLDTGDMLLVESIAIELFDTTGSLHDKLAAMGGRMVVQALQAPDALVRVPQPADGITYAHKIEKREAAIDWSQSADSIVRRIRAFDPFPGASTVLAGETIKVWAAQVSVEIPPESAVAGSIHALTTDCIAIVAMNSIVNISQLQRPGGKRLSAAEFLRGCALQPGMVLGAPV